jgi:hypothetical protein
MELLLELLLLQFNLLLLELNLLLHYAGETVVVALADLVCANESGLLDFVAEEELFLFRGLTNNLEVRASGNCSITL